jgi:hypothetical protein
VHNVRGSLIEDNLFERIGGLDIERIWETAGLKFHQAHGVLIRRNVFRHIRAGPGLWLDFLNANCRVTGNLFHDIESILGGVYIEVSHATNLVDGNVFWDIRGACRTPPDHGYAGPAVNIDTGEGGVVAHNFFGRVRDHYAVACHLIQAARVVRGRVGLCRRQKVMNNVFAECPRRILFGRAEENRADGNLFDARDDRTSLCIEHPSPQALLDLAAWREFFGHDVHGTQGRVAASFDPETLTLGVSVEGDLPEPQPVDELGEGERPPGPFAAGTWRVREGAAKGRIGFALLGRTG